MIRYFKLILALIYTLIFFLSCKEKEVFINNSRTKIVLNGESISSIFFSDDYKGFATNENTLFKTLDGGESWKSIEIHDEDYFEESLPYLYSGSRLFMAVKSGESKIYMSSDEGDTWGIVFSGNFEQFKLVDESNGFITINNQLYRFSIDNQQVNISYIPLFYIPGSFDIDYFTFANNQLGYVYDYFDDEFYVSTDNGNTWFDEYEYSNDPISYTISNLYKMDFKGDIGLAISDRGDVSYTDDLQNWYNLNLIISQNLKSVKYLDCQILDDEIFYLCGLNSLYKVTNLEPKEYFMLNGASLVLKKIFFTNPNLGYGIDLNGNIIKIDLI